MSEKNQMNVGGVISVLIFLGVAAWWYFGGVFPQQAPNRGVTTGLSVSDARIKKGEFNIRSVVGTVKNTATKTYGYVQVSINLYDSSGNQVGSTLANVNNLELGVSWDFEAIIMEDNATTFKVMDVTGF